MPRRRLGVVLLVPPPVAHEVDGLRRALGDPGLGKVPPHITLVPPVNVREEELGTAWAVVRDAAGAIDPLTLSLGPVTTFLPVNPVVYLAVGGPSLASLHGLREALKAGPLDRPVTHDFVPHVTVAEELAEERIHEAVGALGHYRHALITIRTVHLLEERRDDDGHRMWEPVAGVALGAPAVVARGGLELVIEVGDRVPPDTSLGDGGWGDLVVVGRREGVVVGLAGGRVRGSKAWLEGVAVDPALEGEGIGSHLVAAFESEAAERGAERVFARAEPGARAESFLAGRGWGREDPPPMVRGRIGPVGDR